MDNKRPEIRFNVTDVVKYIGTSVKDSNQLTKIIKSSKLDDSVVGSINEYFKNINIITSSVTKIFQSISDTEKIKPVNPIKLLWNLELSVVNLNLIIKQIPKILKGLDTDTMKELVLNLSPSKIDITKTTNSADGETTTVDKTLIDKMTPFDLIKCVFDLLNSLNDIKLVNPIKVVLSLKLLDMTLKTISGSFQKILGTLALIGKQRENIINKSKDAIDAFKVVFDGIKTIIDDIFYIVKWSALAIIAMTPIILFTSLLSGFIKTILFLVSVKDTTGKDKSISIFKSILDIIKNVVLVALILLPLSPIFIISSAALIIASLFVSSLIAFIYTIEALTSLLNVKSVKSINVKFKHIDSITKNLLSIAINTITLSLISILAIPALVINTLFVLSLVAFIYTIKALTSLLNVKLVKSIDVKFKHINSITKNLLSIALNISLLSLISIIAIPALVIDTLFVLALTGFIKILQIMINVAKIKFKDIFNLIILSLFIGMLVVIASAVLLLSIVGSKINWIGILSIMGAILAFSVLAIGIGFVASLILPIIGAATLGLLGITVLIGLLTLTAWMLYKLQNFELDSEKIKSVIISIIDNVKLIIYSIFGPDETEGKKSDKGWFGDLIDIVGGPFRKLKTVAESLLTVPFLLSAMISIGCLFLIANMLEKISEIEVSKNLETKIKQIIGTAKSIITAINTPDTSVGATPQEDKKDKSWLSSVGEFLGDRLKNIGQVLSNLSGTGVLISLLPNICLLRTIIDVLNDVDKYKVSGNISDKVTQIIKTAQIVSASVSDDSKVNTIDPKKVRQFGNFVDDSVKYFKHINKLDVSKVKSLGDMYEKMGQFMEKLQDAPIDEIADALVNKISPALNDINGSLSNKSAQPQTSEKPQLTTQNTPLQSSQSTYSIQTQPTQQKQVDYSTMLENIEDLLEQIKQKLNVNQQLAF